MNRSENHTVSDDDVAAAVQETLDCLDPHISEEASNEHFRETLRKAVEIRLRHAADLNGGYLRGNWVAEDDEQRWVAVAIDEGEMSNTVRVLEDGGVDDADIYAAFVHYVFRDAAGHDDDALLVVPVAESLRDVYW